jgi:integrase
VTKRRATEIEKMTRLALDRCKGPRPEQLLEAARRAMEATTAWKTKAGKALEPTTRFNKATALQAGIFMVSGLRLSSCPLWCRLLRGIRRELGAHVSKQAPPLPKSLFRAIARDKGIQERVRAAVVLAWAAALRHGDLRHIRAADLSFDVAARTVFLQLRGAKGYQQGRPAHKRYLDLPRSMFKLVRRNRRELTKVSRNSFLEALRRNGPAEDGRQYGTHSVRRGAATALAEAGVPMKMLAAFLGHTAVETTRRYVEAAARQPEQRAFRKMSRIISASGAARLPRKLLHTAALV